MDFVFVKTEQFQELVNLQIAYKSEIGENCPSERDSDSASHWEICLPLNEKQEAKCDSKVSPTNHAKIPENRSFPGFCMQVDKK